MVAIKSRRHFAPLISCLFWSGAFASPAGQGREPIIDVHMHTWLDFKGNSICVGTGKLVFPGRDPAVPYSFDNAAECEIATPVPHSAQVAMKRTLEIMEQYNMRGVVSGPVDLVKRWISAAPERVIPAIKIGHPDELFTPQASRAMSSGEIRVVGELLFQYAGYAPNDKELEPVFALAEKADLPVSIHLGLSAPGRRYWEMEALGSGQVPTKYRAALGDPLLLEEVLLRHPKMRVYVAHAGYPLLDQLLALMHAHPQVYVDTAWIDFNLPREEFHRYLQGVVRSGFGKRVMFGSDAPVNPDAIPIAIEMIASAAFLSPDEKRDILYHNAVRFLRLKESLTANE